MAYTRAESPQNHNLTKGKNAWADIINAGRQLKEPTGCSLCVAPMEKIATAPLNGGAVRYACVWCQQRYNVIESWKADIPDQSHPEFGAF